MERRRERAVRRAEASRIALHPILNPESSDSEEMLAVSTNRTLDKPRAGFGEAAPFFQRSVLAGTARRATHGPRSSTRTSSG